MNTETVGLCLQSPVLLSWSAAGLQAYFWIFQGSSFVITSNSSLSWQKAFKQLWVWKDPASERWLQSLFFLYFLPVPERFVHSFALLFFESICLMCVSKISQLDSINRDTGYKLAKSINSLCRDYNSYSRNSSKGETFHWGRKKQREYLGSRWHTEKQKKIKQIFSFYCKPHNMELAFRTSWLGSLYSTWLDRQNAVHTNRLPRLFSISISNRIAMVFLDNVDRIMVHFLGDLKHQEWRRRDFNYLWDGQSWLSQLTA